MASRLRRWIPQAYSGKQFLAIAYGYGSNQRSQIKVFQLPDAKLHSTLDSQGSYITSLNFIPGTSLLAAGDFSGGVELWDIETGEKVFTFQPDQRPDDRLPAYQRVYSLGFQPDEKVVMAVFGDGSLKAWKVSSGEPAWSLSLPSPHGWYVSSAAFSPDGHMVALGMPNGPLMLFDSLVGKPHIQTVDQRKRHIDGACFLSRQPVACGRVCLR